MVSAISTSTPSTQNLSTVSGRAELEKKIAAKEEEAKAAKDPVKAAAIAAELAALKAELAKMQAEKKGQSARPEPPPEASRQAEFDADTEDVTSIAWL